MSKVPVCLIHFLWFYLLISIFFSFPLLLFSNKRIILRTDVFSVRLQLEIKKISCIQFSGEIQNRYWIVWKNKSSIRSR